VNRADISSGRRADDGPRVCGQACGFSLRACGSLPCPLARVPVAAPGERRGWRQPGTRLSPAGKPTATALLVGSMASRATE
ncbi:hypothetical protein, partial [Bacillus cereus group sp. Bce005]|uniref:hypothetical protein n=1 Tax=Bacillus cereus group sp. Bce005 TaxID=3445256 RepID=UPI003F698BD7